MATATQESQSSRVLTSTKVGIVTSAKRDKTRTVAIDFQVRHPKYGKYLKKQTKFQVHDEKNVSKLGDRVEIANCRPISRTKSWRLVRVVEASAGQLEHKTEIE
ncbi:MAG: 30S ribosomal protein S17 [Phycisphaeraceae bacterium]|nr:30S ribosomal protein S17 [Phycisphaeraceae bacterium]